MAKKMGRPRIEINWDEFDKLCAMQCTLLEIASWFKCSDETIERVVKRDHKQTFVEYHKQKSQLGKISLRRRMFQAAQDGNVVMQIWLSKQHLGYTDKNEETKHVDVKYVVVWEDERDTIEVKSSALQITDGNTRDTISPEDGGTKENLRIDEKV